MIPSCHAPSISCHSAWPHYMRLDLPLLMQGCAHAEPYPLRWCRCTSQLCREKSLPRSRLPSLQTLAPLAAQNMSAAQL